MYIEDCWISIYKLLEGYKIICAICTSELLLNNKI